MPANVNMTFLILCRALCYFPWLFLRPSKFIFLNPVFYIRLSAFFRTAKNTKEISATDQSPDTERTVGATEESTSELCSKENRTETEQ